MSKRTRGSRRAAQRRQGNRPQPPRAVRTTAAPPVTESSAALELAEERVEERRPSPTEDTSEVRSTATRSRARPSALLAARAASEYVYVAQDVRRIAVVASLLFATMLVLWVLIVVARVIPV